MLGCASAAVEDRSLREWYVVEAGDSGIGDGNGWGKSEWFKLLGAAEEPAGGVASAGGVVEILRVSCVGELTKCCGCAGEALRECGVGVDCARRISTGRRLSVWCGRAGEFVTWCWKGKTDSLKITCVPI